MHCVYTIYIYIHVSSRYIHSTASSLRASPRSSLQLVHPAALDGALQLLVECATRGAQGVTFLPSAVRRAYVAAVCPQGELFAGVKVQERDRRLVDITYIGYINGIWDMVYIYMVYINGIWYIYSIWYMVYGI